MPEVNLLRPRGRYLKKVRRIIFTIVALWALMVFGFQILLFLVQRDPMGSSFLTDARILDSRSTTGSRASSPLSDSCCFASGSTGSSTG